ncbi:LysR family transcriptional regulator [Ochrobactrum sp. 30A/1000/2015]|uniref:LysR family transcriptional regulator n=1 Tax=Brucella intermedia LMG 3301 TaxID=641118 RepID=C4WNU8_9HYPH|nr:LysR family transcriptional regulator [Brucella intermedia LMG 3301]OAE48033.1 LysR family transcriptional regulator [Brucella intermedia]OOC50203.1 LysR family transcriptional regulator [Brucella intermedia M86]PJT20533.1 LysR family transcriptional regulator [Ochrobactrum sp. 30A/1000/2015]PJT36672.1 LysR family transcriptional regulator [Ochrobactrum sp. 27A/999/2015]PJT41359.1 LysR family transcriptional regulator [Ochrobactrum sp. 23A/997/2015]
MNLQIGRLVPLAFVNLDHEPLWVPKGPIPHLIWTTPNACVADGFEMGKTDRSGSKLIIAVLLELAHSNAVVSSPDFVHAGKPIVPTDLNRFRCIWTRLQDGAMFRWRLKRTGCR